MLKPFIRPAIVAAVLLASTDAQAHQYAQQISSWTARLQHAEKTIRDIRCSVEDLDNLVTCEPANTARVVARLLATVKPETSDADAREIFQIAARVMSLTDGEQNYKPMYATLEAQGITKTDEEKLDRGLTELMHLSGEIGLVGLGEKVE